MTKLKKKNCDKTKKEKHCESCEKLPWELVGCQGVEVIKKNCDNSKTQIVKKKTLKNSNCDNSKTQIVTKLKNSNCDKTQKLKLRPNIQFLNMTKLKKKNQIVTKLKKKIVTTLKTQIVTKL